METALVIITVIMFMLATYAESRHKTQAGLRTVTWEEFARSHKIDTKSR